MLEEGDGGISGGDFRFSGTFSSRQSPGASVKVCMLSSLGVCVCVCVCVCVRVFVCVFVSVTV